MSLDDMDRKEDAALMRHMYKVCREYGRCMALYDGEIARDHPRFVPGSAAAVPVQTAPVAADASDIMYSAEDDRAIEAHIRANIQTAWHSVSDLTRRHRRCLCGVPLNAYGIWPLKVADTPIAPSNVATNTYSTAITIGEKAAVIIAEELGTWGL